MNSAIPHATASATFADVPVGEKYILYIFITQLYLLYLRKYNANGYKFTRETVSMYFIFCKQ